jgi:hypothetical protein
LDWSALAAGQQRATAPKPQVSPCFVPPCRAPRQILSFIDCQLFNQLLLRPELCSARNSRAALRGLKQIDGLLLAVGVGAGEAAGGDGAWQALNHTRQVSGWAV